MHFLRLIDLQTAASEIKQSCDDAEESRTFWPFFFMVGAGISYPPVPLSTEIASQCRTVAEKYGRTGSPPGSTALDVYSHWFELAYPTLALRQKYLKKLIADGPISHANFRLAHIFASGKLGKIVVTTNFDDYLSRAFTLFGVPHIVCDHAKTVERIDPEDDRLQILHVHGSYRFYDCLNLKAEVTQGAMTSPYTTHTIVEKLNSILSRHVPLVVGYSGWDSDAFMSALKRRFEAGPLPNNVYWFCYKRDQVQSFPAWLLENQYVRLVVPTSATLISVSQTPEKSSAYLTEASGTSGILASESKPTGVTDRESLSAAAVLDALILTFGVEPPAITRQPIRFFADYLHKLLPRGQESPESRDFYFFEDVISQVKKAGDLLDQAKQAEAHTESQIGAVREAVRGSKYREAIGLARSVDQKDLSREQVGSLIEATWLATRGLLDNSSEELQGYEFIEALSKSPLAEGASQRRAAMALVNKGVTLGQLNRSGDEVAAYDEVLRRFGEATEPAVREPVATALVNKGIALGLLNRNEDAIAAYEEVLQRFGEATEPALLVLVARALFNKGNRLGQLNRNEDAIANYDELLRRFGEATEPDLRLVVARALFNKGNRLGQLNRSEEEIAAYDEVFLRFGQATEPALCEAAAKALVNKGVTLGQLSRSEEEITAYEEVLKRFSETTEPAVREQVAWALVNKGVTLGQLNRNEDAIAAFDDVLRRFGEATESVVREAVATALVNRGIALGRLNRSEDEIAAYDEVLRRFGDATEPAARDQVAKALLNKGIALGQLNRNEDEIAAYDEVLLRFAEATEPTVREQVAKALLNKGVTLGQLNRSEDAIATCDQVIQTFENSKEAELQEQVARARRQREELLGGEAGQRPD